MTVTALLREWLKEWKACRHTIKTLFFFCKILNCCWLNLWMQNLPMWRSSCAFYCCWMVSCRFSWSKWLRSYRIDHRNSIRPQDSHYVVLITLGREVFWFFFSRHTVSATFVLIGQHFIRFILNFVSRISLTYSSNFTGKYYSLVIVQWSEGRDPTLSLFVFIWTRTLLAGKSLLHSPML